MPYKDTSDDWLFFAKTDLEGAQELFDKNIFHLACFHAQQAIEKSLKAAIRHASLPIPKIHDLVALYTRIANLSLEDLPRKEDISFVNQFYVPTRYPDTFPGSLPEGLPTKEDAQRALDIARQCVSAVIQSIHHGEVTHE